jgi:hypothetical protein
MENQITRLVVFNVIKMEDWLFRTSIANKTNIMVMASCTTIPDSFMMRFFTNPEDAKLWIEYCSLGKANPLPE